MHSFSRPVSTRKMPHLSEVCPTTIPPSAAFANSVAALRKGQNVCARSEALLALSSRLRARKSSPNESGVSNSLSPVALFLVECS